MHACHGGGRLREGRALQLAQVVRGASRGASAVAWLSHGGAACYSPLGSPAIAGLAPSPSLSPQGMLEQMDAVLLLERVGTWPAVLATSLRWAVPAVPHSRAGNYTATGPDGGRESSRDLSRGAAVGAPEDEMESLLAPRNALDEQLYGHAVAILAADAVLGAAERETT